jgi:hypothetical protein
MCNENLQDSFVRQNAAFKIGVFNVHGASPFRAIARCDAAVADPEPAVNRALAAEMRKVYSSCAISAMLALMISPICEHDSITESLATVKF